MTPKRIFLFFSTAEVAELLSFSLETGFHCAPCPFFSAKEAVPAIKNGGFDLAVLDTSLPDGMLIFEQVREAKIPYVLHHPEGKSPEVRGPKIKVFRENELLGGIKNAMQEIKAEPVTEDAGEQRLYARISMPLLMLTRPLAADVFIRLSDLKYVKLFHKGMTFSPEDKKKYHEQKKIPYLYVHRDSLNAVAVRINAMLEKLLKAVPAAPKKETAPVLIDTVETIHELARHIGFTPEVQKIVKNNVNLVVKEMLEVPSLAAVLSNMERNKDKYIAAHSQMLAEIGCAIATGMEWGSEMSLKKLAMAALLHDMSISDNKLCAVKDMKELEARKAEFNSDAIDEYKNHTKRAALAIQGMKEVPADVDKIVYQHHELPKGTGFPEALGHTHIHPLAATLSVAHDLVDWLIEHPGKLDMPAFLEAHREKFSAGAFKKLIKSMEEMKI
ncbi:MAG: HD domain-containing phosphohydrolase [Bdellovibrionota bacterium]